MKTSETPQKRPQNRETLFQVPQPVKNEYPKCPLFVSVLFSLRNITRTLSRAHTHTHTHARTRTHAHTHGRGRTRLRVGVRTHTRDTRERVFLFSGNRGFVVVCGTNKEKTKKNRLKTITYKIISQIAKKVIYKQITLCDKQSSKQQTG